MLFLTSQGDIFFVMNQDNGKAFSHPINLSNNTGNLIYDDLY
jgi:hypothetical protein